MFEVIYSLDGILRKIIIPANDSVQVQSIITNMFSGTKIEIIDIKRR